VLVRFLSMANPHRRGRPRRADGHAHRARVLTAARECLVEQGYERTTMLAIARRSGSSKETLYRWFGDKAGLFRTLIEEEGARTVEGLRRSLDDDGDPVDVLTEFGVRLLTLLTDDWSLTANRAAMSSPDLAEFVLAHGRHAVGPEVERYLAALHARGVVVVPDAAVAFTELYGLVVRDTQIRVLLGERRPTRRVIRRQAEDGVRAFWTMHDGGGG
jgi:AcrR family transcriptional regulator